MEGHNDTIKIKIDEIRVPPETAMSLKKELDELSSSTGQKNNNNISIHIGKVQTGQGSAFSLFGHAQLVKK